jgi:hypothetical protein
VATVSLHEKKWLFNGFLIAIKRPDAFPEAREYAEQWLSSTENEHRLRPYRGKLEQLLYQEDLPEKIQEVLKKYHDDYVEQMTEERLEQYRSELSPRNILALSA